MESKEYFEKVMYEYSQHRHGRSLRSYCRDEGIDYNWILKARKTYLTTQKEDKAETPPGFIPLTVADEPKVETKWEVEKLLLRSPTGDFIEIKSSSLFVVADLLQKMS